MKGAASIGIAIVAAHAAAFAALAAHSAGTDLAIVLRSPATAPSLTLDGAIPDDLADRVTITSDAASPGLRRKHWSVTYRGDFTREVGATQLVGPFQDPDRPACSGRVVVGQRLLDDGHAGPDTIAGVMAAMIDRELRGQNVFPAGDYTRIDHLALQWAQLEHFPFDRGLVGAAGAPHGYVRASLTVVFSRVEVPILVAMVPETRGDKLHFRIEAHALLSFDNRALQWLSDTLGGDKLATMLASHQIDNALVTTLAPPPPFELGDGQRLTFTYCDGPIEISDGAWGALPFAVALGRVAGSPTILPPHFAPGLSLPEPKPQTTLSIDLDLDALDAILFELWRTGWLDRQLALVGLDRRFNTEPIVTEYLSIRISPLRLALPPVIEPGPGAALHLAADARIAIADGDQHATTGRVFGALDLDFRAGKTASPTVTLGALELACEQAPTTLVPCYADLVAAMRDRGDNFHGALTSAFAKLLDVIFVGRRLGAPGLPAEVAVAGAIPSANRRGIHLELAAALVAK